MDQRSASPAIPAATLILFRDRPDAAAELLFVERAATMAFAPGAIVFPGGRVDPGDEALAAMLAGAPDDAASRIAAIRETIEETGLAIGVTACDEVKLRDALSSGMAMGEALRVAGATLDLDVLIPFARWMPSHQPTRVFDTRFYLARAPQNAIASVDAGENVRLFWATAAAMLADADAGRVTIIFPTRRNLERLATLPDLAAATADAEAHPVRLISPWIETRDGVEHLCIPADAGYPVTSEALATVVRG